jgi:DNA-binding transcriptional ArsR family regulator
MILSELFGENARIKILEELISNWDFFLTVEEIARMSDVSKKSVYIHMQQLNQIGILIVENEGSKRFKLNPNDERAIAMALIESGEYIRKMKNFENESESKNGELLSLSVSNNDNTNLLKYNSNKMNNVIKSIPMINFIW